MGLIYQKDVAKISVVFGFVYKYANKVEANGKDERKFYYEKRMESGKKERKFTMERRKYVAKENAENFSLWEN